jgi:hypothetical protein
MTHPETPAAAPDLSAVSDEALVAEVARRNLERQARAEPPMKGQTYIGDRFIAQECPIGRCPEWQRGDVLHRHWRDQATGNGMVTPTADAPTALSAAGGVTSIQVGG